LLLNGAFTLAVMKALSLQKCPATVAIAALALAQGSLTEGKGSVQLTSTLRYLVL